MVKEEDLAGQHYEKTAVLISLGSITGQCGAFVEYMI